MTTKSNIPEPHESNSGGDPGTLSAPESDYIFSTCRGKSGNISTYFDESRIMEKKQTPANGVESDMNKLKIASNIGARDAYVGEMLEINTTPEMERRVLWKLDLL